MQWGGIRLQVENGPPVYGGQLMNTSLSEMRRSVYYAARKAYHRPGNVFVQGKLGVELPCVNNFKWFGGNKCLNK